MSEIENVVRALSLLTRVLLLNGSISEQQHEDVLSTLEEGVVTKYGPSEAVLRYLAQNGYANPKELIAGVLPYINTDATDKRGCVRATLKRLVKQGKLKFADGMYFYNRHTK